METKIQKQIIDYFSYFEEFHNSAKTCLKNCQNCALAINKFIIRCRKIKEAYLSGTPLEEFDGLQSKLIAALHNLISDEIREIKSNLCTIEELFDKLSNKHRAFLENSRGINLKDQTTLVKGTPLQPPLKQLLEFAQDSLTFASEVCARIETPLSVLSLKGLNTEFLADNYRIAPDWEPRVNEILAYTSFCSENQI